MGKIEEKMAEARKNVKSKVVIGVPYNVGDTEFANLMGSLGEMNRDNFFQYTVDVCKECENCGAINDTVKLTETKRVDSLSTTKETQKRMLCDWCVRDLLANGYKALRVKQ